MRWTKPSPQGANRTYTSPAAAAFLPKATSSRSSIRARRQGTSPASIFTPSSTRPSPAGPGTPHQGQHPVSGRSADLSQRLRQSFDKTLELHRRPCRKQPAIMSPWAQPSTPMRSPTCASVAKRLDNTMRRRHLSSLPPLFADKQEYEAFHARHMKATVPCHALRRRLRPRAYRHRLRLDHHQAGRHRPTTPTLCLKATVPTSATRSRL